VDEDNSEKKTKYFEGQLKAKEKEIKKRGEILGQKENAIGYLSNTMKKKEDEIIPLKNEIARLKKGGIGYLTKTIQEKEDEIIPLKNEIIRLKNEISEIKNSPSFKIVRKISSLLDFSFPNRTKRGELKQILSKSADMINDEGLSNYLAAVKEKIERHEIKITSPMKLTRNDKQKLIQDVKTNKEKRLQIKHLDKKIIENDKFDILNNSFLKSKSKENIKTKIPIIVCTIISKNYLAYARTFTQSFLQHNPDGKVFVLLVDEIQKKFEPSEEQFTLVNMNDLNIPDARSFCFKYSTLELCTAVKAHFMNYLLDKYELKKLLYFDPDILITNSLSNIWNLLDEKSIILTPHITFPIEDDKKPSEVVIMQAGEYNLGFIGVSDDNDTREFLKWWNKRLYDFGFMEPLKGFHVDQKWISLVPSLFENHYIIHHPGYNVAYWNISHREIKISDGKLTVNEKPLYFFHFSGFVPENIDVISIHQNRFNLNDLEHLRPLFELYRDLLIENGYFESKEWLSVFEYFDNGVKIPEKARRLYGEYLKKGKKFDDPFSTKLKNSFIQFLNQNVDEKSPPISRLWYHTYKEREDLHYVFPHPLGKNRESFFQWINTRN